MKDMLPVIFRTDGKEVTAFFPTLGANPGFIVCYAHIGQHSEASSEYYYSTKPAKENEYSDLLNELTQVYDDCELVVKKRWRRV